MRILTLNATDGGRQVIAPLFSRLPELRADVITLQEMRRELVTGWRARLREAGFEVLDTFALMDELGLDHSGRFRQDGLLLATRYPLAPLDPTRWGLPWPERVLSAVVDSPDGRFAVHTVHVPNASTGISLYNKGQRELGADRLAKKTETFEAIFRGLEVEAKTLPTLLTGDFNTPRSESSTGEVGYWQDSCPSQLRPQLHARWLNAERNVIQGLAGLGMYDVFRRLHGYGVEAFSWQTTNGKGRYRYDHVFASESFAPLACEYLHEFRLNANHHAALSAEVALR